MRYFVLSTPGQADEVARWKRHSAASYWDAAERRWIPDPLLAIELSSGDEWRRVDPSVLPEDLVADDPEPERLQSGHRSTGRRSVRGGLFGRFR